MCHAARFYPFEWRKKKAHLISGQKFKSEAKENHIPPTHSKEESVAEKVVTKKKDDNQSKLEQLALLVGEKDQSNTVQATPHKSDGKTPSGVSQFSISSIRLKKEALDKKNKEVQTEILDAKFSFEDFQNHWKNYAQWKQKEGQSNIAALFSIADIQMESQSKIHISVPSNINKVELEKEFLDFKPYITEKLNNNQFQCIISVTPAKRKEFYITAEEKYQKLVEINPAIAELRSKLDLDI